MARIIKLQPKLLPTMGGMSRGDKIPTKVGSGRVEIGIGMTFYPDRRDFSRSGWTKAKVGSGRGHRDKNRDKSGCIGENRGIGENRDDLDFSRFPNAVILAQQSPRSPPTFYLKCRGKSRYCLGLSLLFWKKSGKIRGNRGKSSKIWIIFLIWQVKS